MSTNTKPLKLYKYYPLNAYSLAGLIRSKLWISSPISLNDPYDCSLPPFKVTPALLDFAKRILVSIGHAKPEDPQYPYPDDANLRLFIRRSIREQFDNAGICSFTSDPTHPLMWSQYADQHKGFCVEYDTSVKSSFTRNLQQVNYQEHLPPIDPNWPYADVSDMIAPYLRTKSSHWAYEQEWRLILSRGNALYSFRDSITSIIFGSKMSPEDQRLIIQCVHPNNPAITFKESTRTDHQFIFEVKDRIHPTTVKRR